MYIVGYAPRCSSLLLTMSLCIVEGTLTPELRWQLGKRNGITPRSERLKKNFKSLEELKSMYNLLQPRSIKGENQVSAFFDAYYGGMEVLRLEEDFYDLAMAYFVRAAGMNVRYCEVFFDPQAHIRRGVEMRVVMNGLKRAQIEAAERLNVGGKRLARSLALTELG